MMDQLIGAGEAGLSVLTGATGGAIGTIGGALGGIAGQIASGELGTQEGGERAQQSAIEAAQALTYQPRTQAGQQQVQALGGILEPLAALAPIAATIPLGATTQGVSTAAGAALRSAAPRIPGVQQVANALKPSVLVDTSGKPSAGFAKVLKANDIQFENIAQDLSGIPKTAKPQEAVTEIIKKKIERGDTDDFLASKKIDKNTGAVVDDRLAGEALRQGFRPGDVQMIKSATPKTAERMQQMLNIRRQTYANERMGLNKRPSDVLGESLLTRFTFIRNRANSARNELNAIAETTLPGKAIDVNRVANTFFDTLEDLDVTVDRSKGVPSIDFKGSIISKDPSSQRVIRNVAELLAEDRPPDALRAHKLKRQLDAMIDFEKKSSGGLTESGRNVAKTMRATLNSVIRDVSPEYAEVNDVLSKSLQSMNQFERIMGPSIDLWAPGANKAIGQDLRGIMSNRKSRVKLENSVNSIDAVARELGGVFDDNLGDLALFAKTLDDQFGASARTSFSGDIESATRRVARGAAGITEEIIDRVAKKAGDMRNINDQQAFKALDDLLRERVQEQPSTPGTQLIIPD
jgi:hypothetical protein